MKTCIRTPDTHSLIAPCGINCSLCRAYLRKRNPCPGCNNDTADVPVSRSRCVMKYCPEMRDEGPHFCYVCGHFPCPGLQKLDKRYRTRYGLSPIGNLLTIRERGMKTFLTSEQEKWQCRKCSSTVCMHTDICPECGTRRRIEPLTSLPK